MYCRFCINTQALEDQVRRNHERVVKYTDLILEDSEDPHIRIVPHAHDQCDIALDPKAAKVSYNINNKL